MGRRYKWQPHNGARHAVPRELAVGHVGRTLCDVEVTGHSDTWPDEARCWPTCHECDLAWRAHERILPWPRNERSRTTRPDTSALMVSACTAPSGGP
ncbi:zinc finger protein [Lentzea kentuckyensis]|uniref:zinc finger protein n=1 Tax=Lentzea kentuckyensis TaxID=360086 RepID=UPI000A3C97E2|nr:zinc finger protein [Lentzea kentuckyensis]